MKKRLFISGLLVLLSSCSLAIEDNILMQKDEIQEQPIILETEGLDSNNNDDIQYSPYSKQALKGILTKEYDLNYIDEGMFKDQQTFKYKKGPLEETYTQINTIMSLAEEIPQNGKSSFKHNINVIDIAFRGKFKGGHERFKILTDVSPQKENFFNRLILDAYIETDRIPHHSLIIGTSRPYVGYEGGTSPHMIPLLNRSQTARSFGGVRKTGVRLKGDFKYIDYDIGGFSSDTYYTEFFPGVETDIWVNFKPLANFDKEKAGNLNISAGFQAGNRNSHDFRVTSAALRYDHKKFALSSEFQYANGSNGKDGITDDVRWGYNATFIYKLTKKLHLVTRFDDFNNNVHIKNNNTREYSAGINYYILGQTLKLVLNYIFCQNASADDSHKIILGTQILL